MYLLSKPFNNYSNMKIRERCTLSEFEEKKLYDNSSNVKSSDSARLLHENSGLNQNLAKLEVPEGSNRQEASSSLENPFMTSTLKK